MAKKKSSKKSDEPLSGKSWRFAFLLGALISITLLYIASWKMNWVEVGQRLARMDWRAIAVGLVLVNLHNFLLAKRWHLLVKPFGAVNYWMAFWSLRISFFFNASLPARLGEPFRVFYITRKSKASAARVIGAMGADRFLDFTTMALLVYISAVVLGLRGTLPPTKTIVTSTLIFAALFIALTRLPKRSKNSWLHRLLEFRARIYEGIYSLRNLRILLPATFISFLGWVIEATLIVTFAYGIGVPISLFKAFMVVAGVSLAIAIPSSPGHFGTFEFAAIEMLHLLGVPRADAATIAILYHIIQLIPTLLIGAYGYQFHFFKTPRLRQIRTSAPSSVKENSYSDVISWEELQGKESSLGQHSKKFH